MDFNLTEINCINTVSVKRDNSLIIDIVHAKIISIRMITICSTEEEIKMLQEYYIQLPEESRKHVFFPAQESIDYNNVIFYKLVIEGKIIGIGA